MSDLSLRIKASTLLLGLCMALGLAACAPKPVGHDLFPLGEGHQWRYDVKTEWENNVIDHEPLVLETLGQSPLDDGPAWLRRSDAGISYWLRGDETGIYRVATKSELDADPRYDKERRYVLKAPLTAGSTWQSDTTAYLLQRRQEFPREIRHTHPAVKMVYSIEATGLVVDSRAGRFEGCVKVKGQASLRLFADPVVGWKDMPLITQEWYCPGVGLVRLVREEPANSTFLTGGTLTMELLEWK